jgi:hypothetical protein
MHSKITGTRVHVGPRRTTGGGIRRGQGKHTGGGHNNNHRYGKERKREENQERKDRSFYQAFTGFTIGAHTHDPCIIASHALLLCKVVRKWAHFASAASEFAAIAVLVTPESPTADSCGYACGAWSSIGGGVASRGDGVGEGDNDSEGVELVECYSPECTEI